MSSQPPPIAAEEQESPDFLATQFVFGNDGVRSAVGLDVLVTKVALDFVGLTSEAGDNCVKRNLEALREATGTDAICIALFDPEAQQRYFDFETLRALEVETHDEAGDLGAPALALGAQFVIAGAGGTRTVEADDFFVDLFETAIGEDEILTEVRIPKHTGWGAHYEKFVRVQHQWPIVAVAASSAQVARPWMASLRSGSDGKVGAIRMFLSSGSFRYGNDAPASVTAMPASLASCAHSRAKPGAG